MTEATGKVYTKILLLVNGTSLLGQIVNSEEAEKREMICVKLPMEIFDNVETGEIWLRSWVPYSLDEFIFIPAGKIMTVVNPDKELITNYHQALQGEVKEVHDNEKENEEEAVLYH